MADDGEYKSRLSELSMPLSWSTTRWQVRRLHERKQESVMGPDFVHSSQLTIINRLLTEEEWCVGGVGEGCESLTCFVVMMVLTPCV